MQPFPTQTTTNFLPDRNRILEPLHNYYRQELQFFMRNPQTPGRSEHQLRERAAYLQHLRKSYLPHPTPAEKATLQFIAQEEASAKAAISKSPFRRLLNSPFIRSIRSRLTGTYASYFIHQTQIYELQQEIIAQANIIQLSKTLKEKGFKIDITPQLQEMLRLKIPQFSIPYYDIHQPDTDYTLQFTKIRGTSSYALTSFQASSITTSQEYAEGKEPPITQNFQLTPDIPINAKQAAALVNKRPIEIAANKWLYIPGIDLNDPFPIKTKFFDLLKAIEDLPNKLDLVKHNNMDKVAQKIAAGEAAEVKLPGKQGMDTFHINADLQEGRLTTTEKNVKQMDSPQQTEDRQTPKNIEKAAEVLRQTSQTGKSTTKSQTKDDDEEEVGFKVARPAVKKRFN